jgi:methyl-accepting chemotaxis protein
VNARLNTKIAAGTLSTVALGMAIFGIVKAHLMVLEVRERAQREATEKTEETLNTLQIVDTLSSQEVRSSLKVMVREGLLIGDPEIKGAIALNGRTVPDLRLGNSSQVGNFGLVDRMKGLTGNSATLFVRQGDEFIRVSTNVLKPDGSRATGTALDNQGRVYAAIREGKSFYGVVDILGSPYMTGYEPINDKSGRTIGIWFVGAQLATLSDLGVQISKTRILDHGYVALLKTNGDEVFGPNGMRAEDIQNRARQPQQNGWIVCSRSFDPWGYALQTAYPEADISSRSRSLQGEIAICALLMMCLVAAVEYPLMTRLVLRPVAAALERTTAIAAGDLTGSDIMVQSKDELGDLAETINAMQTKLRDIITSIAGNAQQVASSGKNLSAASERISSNS